MKNVAYEFMRLVITTLGGEITLNKFYPKDYYMARIGGRNYVIKATVEELEELFKQDKITDYTSLAAYKLK